MQIILFFVNSTYFLALSRKRVKPAGVSIRVGYIVNVPGCVPEYAVTPTCSYALRIRDVRQRNKAVIASGSKDYRAVFSVCRSFISERSKLFFCSANRPTVESSAASDNASSGFNDTANLRDGCSRSVSVGTCRRNCGTMYSGQW